MSDIEQTLMERGERYGDFEVQAMVVQGIKQSLAFGVNWERMEDFHREALDMIASKMARAANGDANYIDTWRDIAGYATLVENILREREKANAKHNFVPHAVD